MSSKIREAYTSAKERYAELDIDTDAAMATLKNIQISIPCWQGDDVGGFETPDSTFAGGGIQATGNYPGKPRTVDELRTDIEEALSLIPGDHRLNLHAIYGEFGSKKIDRNEITPEHFTDWIEWAKKQNIKLDFNATLFSHPRASAGFTLSSKDADVRAFWIEHVKRCRTIAAAMGRALDDSCIHNLWIPDGMKDYCVDRVGYRELLKNSLDEIYATHYDIKEMKDAMESKLFGLGSESYVVGSHEFYMGYALLNNFMVCLDTGHFHPTESIADKLSALILYSDELLLHISRGVRWDSDHVVIFNDETRDVVSEIVRNNALNRVHIALDFFDASINRIAAWVIGTRATIKALLYALLEPTAKLRDLEEAGNYSARLALLDELRVMPFGTVWNYYCLISEVPPADKWLSEIEQYEREVLNRRKV